jgi:hypothetical protein
VYTLERGDPALLLPVAILAPLAVLVLVIKIRTVDRSTSAGTLAFNNVFVKHIEFAPAALTPPTPILPFTVYEVLVNKIISLGAIADGNGVGLGGIIHRQFTCCNALQLTDATTRQVVAWLNDVTAVTVFIVHDVHDDGAPVLPTLVYPHQFALFGKANVVVVTVVGAIYPYPLLRDGDVVGDT